MGNEKGQHMQEACAERPTEAPTTPEGDELLRVRARDGAGLTHEVPLDSSGDGRESDATRAPDDPHHLKGALFSALAHLVYRGHGGGITKMSLSVSYGKQAPVTVRLDTRRDN